MEERTTDLNAVEEELSYNVKEENGIKFLEQPEDLEIIDKDYLTIVKGYLGNEDLVSFVEHLLKFENHTRIEDLSTDQIKMAFDIVSDEEEVKLFKGQNPIVTSDDIRELYVLTNFNNIMETKILDDLSELSPVVLNPQEIIMLLHDEVERFKAGIRKEIEIKKAEGATNHDLKEHYASLLALESATSFKLLTDKLDHFGKDRILKKKIFKGQQDLDNMYSKFLRILKSSKYNIMSPEKIVPQLIYLFGEREDDKEFRSFDRETILGFMTLFMWVGKRKPLKSSIAMFYTLAISNIYKVRRPDEEEKWLPEEINNEIYESLKRVMKRVEEVKTI